MIKKINYIMGEGIMKVKKMITAVLMVSAIASQLIMPQAAKAEDSAPVLWYDFEDGAKDVSGNGLDGTVNGAVIKKSMAIFDGTDDYIQMPNGILKDADSATVAIYLKPEIEKANQFTWCIGNTSTTGYMFLNTYNPSSKLRAAITTTTYTAEEALASDSYVKKDEWTSIIAVYNDTNSVLYRDGVAVATANMTLKPSDLGATTANYIAKSVYNDPYFKGSVSDFRIYDKALTAEEVATLAQTQTSSYQKSAPVITGVSGDGIKSYGVEIDTANNTVLIPVKVGTDTSSLSPSFTFDREADCSLTSGTYADGKVRVSDKENSALYEDWTITATERGNAVLDGYYAIACFDGKYYIYPTTDGGSGWDAPYFKCFSSDDLVNWKDEGTILDLKDVSWSNGKNGWAPTIAEKDGLYYFYYSAAPANNGAKNLAVAVSNSPTGPFEDKGVIVQGGSLTGQMIDSAVFIDDDGQAYLYWGNGRMYGAKLSENMVSIDGEIKELTPSNFREGSFMIKRDGRYYMMWSDDDTGSPDYNVRYGTMDSPLGKITGNTVILKRDNADSNLIKGTGHHSVINIPGTDDWYICYHRFNTSLYGNQETQSSAAGNHRETCIDKLEFDESGNIKRVVPTLKGITEPVYPVIPIIKYDFENENLSDITDATFTTGASLVSDSEKDSKVLYLNGTSGSYMEFAAPKDEGGNVLESYTVSFDVKNNTTGNYFNFYIGDGSSNSTGVNYYGVKVGDSALLSAKNSSTEKKVTLSGVNAQGKWVHFDVVVKNGLMQLYVDKVLKGELEGYTMAEVNASVIRFGFSAWSADVSSRAYYDNIEVYDRAFTYEDITGIHIDTRESESADNEKLLFAMNFNNQNMTAIKGKATLTGSISYAESEDNSYAAKFSGGANNYISLSNEDGTNLLAGKDEITITFHKKSGNVTSWWLYAAPDNNAQTYGQEHYLGAFDNGAQNTLAIERYNNAGTRNESPTASYTQGAWQEITAVVGEDKTTLYIDGEAVSEKYYNFKLSDMLGDNPVIYIGRANWGSGEWATGLIDDIAIFDFAPDVELGDLSNVSSDITLPTATETQDGYSITWETSDANTVSATGKVTKPASGKKTATLTATITFGAHTLKKSFDVTVKADNYTDYNLQIKKEKGVDIQKGMYGLFFEDINYSGDGGLYAEMIENDSFESLKSNGSGGTTLDGLYGYTAYPSGGTSGMTLKSTGGLNDNNTHYLETTTSFKNQAYDGVYIEEGKTYNVSVFAKKNTYEGGVKAQVFSDGEKVGEVTLAESLTDEWTKYTAQITPSKTVRHADFVIALDGTGTADFDMVSCIPDDAVMGVFRRDLAEKIKAINPGFLRFPGGCIVEGYNIANRYRWKDTVGKVEERKQNWSRWSCHTNSGLDGGFKHYNQTYGLGFYEYFILCDYLGCAPVPVLNVGLACEYQSKETVPMFESDGVTYTAAFYEYIQDALDLIEFANGDTDTTWGKLRADMGHSEPFNLDTIGIGNEQWAISGNQWYERYEAFEKEIHKLYPDMKLISTSGPNAEGTDFTSAWSWIRNAAKTNDSFTYAVDEHYYRSPDWFLANDNRYDNYARNVKVFAGEYASQGNTLKNAISEAAFMTGLERNADVVYMASYAPLFARENYTQWAPDMIWFDDTESYCSPDYYVQSMYSNNSGDYTLKSTVTGNEDKAYQSVSYDTETGDIIVKIVNPYDNTKRIQLDFNGDFYLNGTADAELLTGVSDADTNSIQNPENVKTVKSQISVTDGMNYEIPPRAFVVMRVHTEDNLITIKSTEKTETGVRYELSVNGDISDYDLYTAVYSGNSLAGVVKNKTQGEITAEVGDDYSVKVMLWEKDTMEPAQNAIE